MLRKMMTVAAALAVFALFAGSASAQYIPPVPGYNQPVYPVQPVFPGQVRPAPIVQPNWTGGVDIINPERLTNPWANQAIPGTVQQFQRYDPISGRFISGTNWIGMDGKQHSNSTITTPDGRQINAVMAPAPGSASKPPVSGRR